MNFYQSISGHYREIFPLKPAQVRFERDYRYLEQDHLIEFNTTLTVKQTGQCIINKIKLYPLRKSKLELVLTEAGFSSLSFFGNFLREPLEETSIPLVVEACL